MLISPAVGARVWPGRDFFNTPMPGYTPTLTSPAGNGAGPVRVFDNDGKPDYLLRNPPRGRRSYNLNNNVLIGSATAPRQPGWNVVGVADLTTTANLITCFYNPPRGRRRYGIHQQCFYRQRLAPRRGSAGAWQRLRILTATQTRLPALQSHRGRR